MTTDLAFVPVNVQLTNKPSLLILLGLLKRLSAAKHFTPVQLFLRMGLCVMSWCVVCQYFNHLSDNCMIKPFSLCLGLCLWCIPICLLFCRKSNLGFMLFYLIATICIYCTVFTQFVFPSSHLSNQNKGHWTKPLFRLPEYRTNIISNYFSSECPQHQDMSIISWNLKIGAESNVMASIIFSYNVSFTLTKISIDRSLTDVINRQNDIPVIMLQHLL